MGPTWIMSLDEALSSMHVQSITVLHSVRQQVKECKECERLCAVVVCSGRPPR
jgi:hypothetical protein